ncbi:AfsR/SARP family transcriptional regulator [Virgisporangium aurantiacum]|uniref:AfsR/SARP family transcriptional regulator n=1 Tax=Virgisporangium aurantiacum TaxID=175570 RepID=UPI00194E321D|nr:BTAD domain-containing putative transcriptional regulator [Virgisporangium aurantiacum]
MIRAGDGLYVDLLGPVGVRAGDVSRPVSGLRRKAVLAVLALHPGEVVSTDRLIDVVWNGDPPASAANALQHHVSYLRRAVGSPDAIASRPSGYVLDLPADRVDVVRAERHVRTARAATEPAEAARHAAAALDLWRGDPLLDVAADGWLAAQAGRLAELRLDANEALAEARLALGEPATVIADLERLAARYPLRERLHGQLMLALYRGGRQAEALEVFQRLRRAMVGELGLDPGPEVRDRAAAILRRDPALDASAAPRNGGGPWIPPAQLPFAVGSFTGRAAELAQLDGVMGEAAGLAAVVGTAGVGKTTLAVHWAHRVAGRFPDGQIFVDLRGFDPDGPARDPAEVTRELLETLGVPTTRIPAGAAAQTALYRSLLAGRRVLVVLDNAGDSAQVRPLLPGSRSAFVLVTSRVELTALVAGAGARPVRLDVLNRSDAQRLLADRLGAARLAAEPDAVDEMVRRCAGLPLALVVAAARAAVRPGFPLAAFAAELREETRALDALSGGDDGTDVRAVLCWSVRALGGEAARLLRWIALHPETDFGVTVAASLAGRPVDGVAGPLAELTGANLVDERAVGRYSVHALLRAYAAELSLRLDPAADRAAAERRLFDHYLATACAAARRLEPFVPAIDVPVPADGVTVCRFETAEAALAWFAAERIAVLGVLRRAHERGFDGHAWRLARAVSGYLVRSGYWADQEWTHETALRAARRTGDRVGAAHAHSGLGFGLVLSGRFPAAGPHLDRAAALFEELGDVDNLIDVRVRQTLLYDRQDRLDDALRAAGSAYDLAASVYDLVPPTGPAGSGSAAGVRSRLLNVLGWCHVRLGDHRTAIRYTEEAVAIAGEDANWLAGALDTLGAAHAGLGDWTPAIAYFERAIALNRVAGDRTCEAESLLRLGDAYSATGGHDAAVEAWRAAASLFETLKHPGAERARALLGAYSGR